MKFPSKVKVLGRVYKMRSDATTNALANSEGLHNPRGDEILLDTTVAPAQLRDAVLHELLHAVWYASALDQKYTSTDEEDAIWTLTPLILALLRDNPKLVKYLCGK